MKIIDATYTDVTPAPKPRRVGRSLFFAGLGLCLVVAFQSIPVALTVSKPTAPLTDSDVRKRLPEFVRITDGFKLLAEARRACAGNFECQKNHYYRASGRTDFDDIRERVRAINEIEASMTPDQKRKLGQ